MASALPNTFRNVIHVFTDFLTVAVHNVLYERNVYPRTSFISARRYGIAVRQNRHPQVCEWINDAVASVEAQLLKGAVERVAVVLYSKSNQALERFVFAMHLPDISAADIDTTMIREGEDEETAASLQVVDMDEHFRAVMATIANCSASLQPLPSNCTFTIAIELRDDGHHAPLSHPQAWVPAHGNAQTDLQPKTTPLRTMRVGELKFEAWVEESANKDHASQSVTTGSDTSKIPSAEG